MKSGVHFELFTSLSGATEAVLTGSCDVDAVFAQNLHERLIVWAVEDDTRDAARATGKGTQKTAIIFWTITNDANTC